MKSRTDRRQIWHALDAAAAAGIRPVIATILRAEGSTPLEAGARALVAPDGTLIAGTVGGGALEFESLRRASSAAGRGENMVFDFALGGPGGADSRPICGGTVRIALQPATTDVLTAHRSAWKAERERRHGVLVTTVTKRADTAAPRIETTWSEGVTGGRRSAYLAEAGREILREPIVPCPRLLIVGAGHVGQALAGIAHLAGFEVAVIDDRPELLSRGAFPPGCDLRQGPIAESADRFATDHETYIALVSRGHRADAEALEALLHKPCAYLGMIGSRRKARIMRDDFLRRGVSTAEAFDRVHTPIGLAIGAESAPEIAVAIVAQLIAVKNSGDPGRP